MRLTGGALDKLATLALATALVLGLGSCSKGMKATETTDVTQTSAGAVAVETITMSASVSAVDMEKRKVTLTQSDGTSQTYKAGPDVANFDQLQVGDQVKAVVTEQIAVNIEKNGPAPSASATAMVALAPVGAKPGGLMAETLQETATISAVDAGKRKVTLTYVDGKTKTYKVNKGIDLSKFQVGDSVTVTVTEGVAITVVKS
jgi:Cu/Ag efflux protein CusF